MIKSKQVFRLSKILKLKSLLNRRLKPRVKKKLERRIDCIYGKYKDDVLNKYITNKKDTNVVNCKKKVL